MRRAAPALLLALAACSDQPADPPEVHETGAPAAVETVSAAPDASVAGVGGADSTVTLDGDRLFLPGSTELAPEGQAMILAAARRLGRGDGPVIRIEGRAAGEQAALRLAQSTAEALSYLGGVPFSRLEPHGVADASGARRVVLRPVAA